MFFDPEEFIFSMRLISRSSTYGPLRDDLDISAPSSSAAEFLGREHQARGRTPTIQGLMTLVRRRVGSGAA
jgi:hypothetical protein